jgi:acyl-CoA synthetase (AMP-forming)/AMP-acid ligase II
MNCLLNISDAVATHARLTPNKIGARDSRRSLTFAAWQTRASQLANGLMALGLTKGDRVALLAYNRVEWMEMYAGLARAGLVAVPLNFRLMTAEIEYILEHSGAVAMIVQDELTERVEPLRKKLKLSNKAFIALGETSIEGWTIYEELLVEAPQHMPTVTVMPSDMSALMYTSGTTGQPKGAIRSHEGSSLIALATALEMGFKAQDTALLVMPMCHANSLYFSHTFTQLGATCVIDDRKSFDPEALLATLAAEKITFTSLVPTHYIMMLGLPPEVKAKYDVSAVEKLMISSAPARKDTKLAILSFFKNGKLYELYGSTEAGWVTLLRPDEQIDRLGTVGREWAGSGAIKLLNSDGIEVKDGEIGELFSKTPYVFDGYWKNPDKTHEAFAGQWCSVGDMALRDQDGFIHLVDRKSNMIISGGENIYPSEVEGVLGSHEKVKDVAVLGIPHEKWGEAVMAFVVLHLQAKATEDELITWCKTRMAGYKRPQSIVFLQEDEMPRTATGKILHRVLRQNLLQAPTKP